MANTFKDKRWIVFGLCLFALICVVGAGMLRPAADMPGDRPLFPKAQLIFERADGQKIPFNVEVATTRQQSEYGLMFIKSLPADAGMVFIADNDQNMMMWMKNTFIPLDMLFVRNDGYITQIITHAKPQDLTVLRSDDVVHGVIEINDGEAARRGIRVGDKALFPAFSGS